MKALASARVFLAERSGTELTRMATMWRVLQVRDYVSFGSTAERVETGARKSYTHKEVARGGAGTNEPECDNTID